MFVQAEPGCEGGVMNAVAGSERVNTICSLFLLVATSVVMPARFSVI